MFTVVRDNGLDVIARGGPLLSGDALAEITGAKLLPAAQSALRSRNVTTGDVHGGDSIFAISPLDGFASGQAVIVATMPTSLVPSVTGLLAPLVGAIALGIVLVIVAGWLIGNYITQPVSELEDGLLAVINGNQTLRFQIEHPELGGLVFRINSLLNALMGVPEDNTDEQGRPSVSPNAQHFQEALSVDESSVTNPQVSQDVIAMLSKESDDAYYARVYRDYIAAKEQLGDPVEGISFDGFIAHIRSSEQEVAAKHGRPVRYLVEVRGNSVVLIAVPMP